MCSTPGGASQRYNRNSPAFRMADIDTASASAAAVSTAAIVQSSGSSVVPSRLRGMEFLRNAFWGSNNSNSGNGSKDEKLGGSNNNSGHKSLFRAFTRFSGNKKNEVEISKNGNSKKKTQKDYQKLNESAASTKSFKVPASANLSRSNTNTMTGEYSEMTEIGDLTIETLQEEVESSTAIAEKKHSKLVGTEEKNIYPLYRTHVEESSEIQKKIFKDTKPKMISGNLRCSSESNIKEKSEFTSSYQTERQQQEQHENVTESLPLYSLIERQLQYKDDEQQQQQQQKEQQQANGYTILSKGDDEADLSSSHSRQSLRYQSVQEKLLPHTNKYQIRSNQNREKIQKN